MDIEQRLQPPAPYPLLDYPSHQEQVIQRFTIFLTDEDENDLKIEESEEEEQEEKVLTKRTKKTVKRKIDSNSKKKCEKPKVKKKRRRKRKSDVNETNETPASTNVRSSETPPEPDHVEKEEMPLTQKKRKKSSFPCHHCNYISSWKTNLEKHMMAQHTGERPYKCPHCEYGSVHQNQMEKHWNTYHLGAVIHCSVCAFSAQAVEVYCKHLSQVHSEQRPLSCEACGRRAVSLSALEMHILDRHKATCQTFTCSLCGYKATVEENLQTHLQNLHRCTECGFKSDSLREIRRHKKKVHRARPSKSGSKPKLLRPNFSEKNEILKQESLINDYNNSSDST